MARSVPPGSVTELVAHVRDVYASRITGEATLPARAGSYCDLPTDLDARLRVALQQRGVTQLYSHQRAAWEAVRAGQHTVIVTPTASGKTLCYNLPVLHAVLSDNVKAFTCFRRKPCHRTRSPSCWNSTALRASGCGPIPLMVIPLRTPDERYGCTGILWCPTPTCCTRASYHIIRAGRSFLIASAMW